MTLNWLYLVHIYYLMLVRLENKGNFILINLKFLFFYLFKDNDVQFNDSDKITNYKDLFRSLLIHEISKRPHKLAVQQIQQWIHTCAIKLKKLNQAHSDILAKYKKNIQFPDLYSELYNL